MNLLLPWSAHQGDCLDLLRQLPDDAVDLVFTSPPYEQARLYLEDGRDLGIARNTEQWVAWLVEVFKECLRVCKGLVAFVVEGQTRKYRWTAGPALLMADLHRAGVHLRKPPVFHRVGIPGSGGPDWLRNDFEFIVCATSGGKLPWSENTAMGKPPKYAPGGEMSYRLTNGTRMNQWGKTGRNTATVQLEGGKAALGKGRRPSHKEMKANGVKKSYARNADGKRDEDEYYAPPTLANPGNVLKINVGGGVMGNELCHENEAPFPEALAEFFIRSFCPPNVCTKCGKAANHLSEVRPHHSSQQICVGCGADLKIPGAIRPGLVLDPFCGSGTSLAVAVRHGRRGLGFDLRASQVAITRKRIEMETPLALLS